MNKLILQYLFFSTTNTATNSADFEYGSLAGSFIPVARAPATSESAHPTPHKIIEQNVEGLLPHRFRVKIQLF